MTNNALLGQGLNGPLTRNEIRQLQGPYVYFFVQDNRVEYIGKTNNPSQRFYNHQKLNDNDEIWVIDLKGWLREVKKKDPCWKARDTNEINKASEELERIFIYIYMSINGAIPKRNSRKDLPSPGVMVFLEMLLKSNDSILQKNIKKIVTSIEIRANNSLSQQYKLIGNHRITITREEFINKYIYELNNLSLQKICKKSDLNQSGTKAELIRKIVDSSSLNIEEMLKQATLYELYNYLKHAIEADYQINLQETKKEIIGNICSYFDFE